MTTPAANDIAKETQEYLHTTGLNIVALLEHARKFEGTEAKDSDFSGQAFSKVVHDIVTAVDQEVTRFIIACKPPALDVEIRALCPKINAGLFQLVQQFGRIPKIAGRTYLLEVRRAVCKTLVAMVLLINSFLDLKVELSAAILADMPYMSSTGVFWEHCKELKQIPVDNRAAVLSIWQSVVTGLVRDAAEELNESLAESENQDTKDGVADEESEDSMDEFSPDIPRDRIEEARNMYKLILSAKQVCEKVGLRCIRDCETFDEEHIMWLDRLLDLGRPVQDSVDELVAALSADGDEWKRAVKLEAASLTEALSNLVTLAITFVDDSHLPWFELCRKRLDVSKHTYHVVR
ncbi:hypothetical protein GGH91_003224 [Coemansia sp. RSA 2671]|nr:hypothetical protein LPJ60_000644 [Coemansia sp. RSA 2675]KAJ2032193.1 hypothetical protein IWW57_000344 [Coemansia sp. S610]KAJ2343349.1 hypothetical protein GGH91_003224 [Coemansia sp. RSA 2671]